MGGRYIVIIGAVTIALLMVSSATAVPHVNTTPVMNSVRKMEQFKRKLYDLEDLSDSQLFKLGTRMRSLSQSKLFQLILNKMKNRLNFIKFESDPQETKLLTATLDIIYKIEFFDFRKFTAKQINEIELNLFATSQSSQYKILKNKTIDFIGTEKYNEIQTEVKSYIADHYDKIRHHSLYNGDFYELLVEICVVILVLSLILFGYELGPIVYALITYIILFVPLFPISVIFGLLAALEIIPGVILDMGLPDFKEILSLYGIVGFLIYILLLSPVILIILLIFFPLYSLVLYLNLVNIIMLEAYNRIFES